MTSTAQLVKATLRAKKFNLHRLLIEHMQKLAANENVLQNKSGAHQLAQAAKDDFGTDKHLLHQSIQGLLEYEQALQMLQQNLQDEQQDAYAACFKKQKASLDKIAGHLWGQYDKPPYADDLNALFKGHNVLGEMFRRDAFERAKQQVASHWLHVENLKKIFKQNPPPELFNAPEIKAVAAFNAAVENEELSVAEFKQAIQKLQQEVFKK